MTSTSLMGGRCQKQGTNAGVEPGGGRSGVTPWAAGMYEKIKLFEIDRPGDAFPFSARLARENGWNRAYAQRVIEEYRRFVCLMATAPHPVTPSEAVDQAWHLHMTYTRSYWDGLCREIVGRPLHHDPTRGGSDESAKFTDWYARTLETYRRVFGGSPPADIWPAPGARFAPTRMQWVDLAKFKLVRRERRKVRGWMWLGLVPVLAASAGCAGVSGRPAAAIGLAVLVVLVVALVVLAVASRAANGQTASRRPRRNRHDGSSGCGSSGFLPFWGGDSCGDSHGHGSDTDSGGHGGSDGGGHGCSGGGGDGGGGCSGGGCGGGGCGGGGD